MKKLILVTPHMSTGGCPQFVLKKIELLKDVYDIYCIEYNFLSADYTVQRDKVKVLLSDRFIPLFDDKHRLIEIINSINPDIIFIEEISETFIDGEIIKSIYRQDRKYKIFESTHSSEDRSNLKRYLPDKFIFVSEFSKKLYDKIGIDSSVIEYPIDKKIKNKNEALYRLKLDPSYIHILNIGLFTPGKNQAYAFEIAKKFEDKNVKFHFVGNRATNFKSYWEPLMENIPSNCVIWGERSDTEDFIMACDLFLFTSKFELNPLVVKEALCFDLPTLMFNLETYCGSYDNEESISFLSGNLDSDTHLLDCKINDILLKDNKIKPPKRTFITFSHGESNDSLCERLRLGLNEFSNYPLKVYRKDDFSLKVNMNDPELWSSGFGYIFKVLSCIKSLEEYDEVVWIDTDCIATNYIDKIWFEGWRISKFPLLPKYRFSSFGNNTSHLEVPMDIQVSRFLEKEEIKTKIGSTDRKFYSQACFMMFNKSCLEFFNEVLSYFNNDYDKTKFPYRILEHGSFGDESIINYLFWKNNFTDNLGEIFLCSQYFNYSLESFIKNNNRENFFTSLNIKPERNIFNNVLFLHGTKDVRVADYLLNHLIKWRKSNKGKIYNPLDEIKLSKYSTSLCDIMQISGSDKSTKHKYTRVYHQLFEKYRNLNINIFELGLGTNNTSIPSNMGIFGNPGASIRGWKEYFPNAKVFGADVDKDILFEEERIKTYFCDQCDSESLKLMWSSIQDDFDIIIDDGLHEFEANVNFLISSLHKLKVGGYFIIEDLLPDTYQRFIFEIENILDLNRFFYKFMEIEKIPTNDSRLLIIHRIS